MKKSWSFLKNPRFNFIDLFAGIGGFRIAMEKFGGQCVFSSEWDKNSQKTYQVNFNDFPEGDITKISEKQIPQHNVLCAGFPCQAFSISGKQKGFKDTRGTLFFDIARIAKYHKPEILFLENVKNLTRHNNGETLGVILETLREINYNPFFAILRSSDFGVPQARERVYIVAFKKDLNVKKFEFPKTTNEIKVVKNILEKGKIKEEVFINRPDIDIYKDPRQVVDTRRPLQIGKINKGGQGERIYSIHAAGITLSAYGGGAASKTGGYLIKNKIRKLTPRECARMQGFPEDFEIPASKGYAYKQFGDSVSLPVLIKIFKKVIEYYPNLNKKTIERIKVNSIVKQHKLISV